MGSQSTRTELIRSECGALMVESSFALSVLLFVAVVGFDLFRFGYLVIASEWTLARHGRLLVVDTDGDGQERAERQRQAMIQYARKIGLELDSARNPNATIEICAAGADCTDGNDAGLSGALISVRIRYSVRMLFNLVEYPFQAESYVRNEPF